MSSRARATASMEVTAVATGSTAAGGLGVLSGTPLLDVEAVSKTYRSLDAETPVLEDASLHLPRGETTSLVGTSGSGKSTLLSLIAGLTVPDSGRIMFDDRDITDLDSRARAELRARRIGIVLQSGNLIPFLTASENVELAIELAGGERRVARARDLLRELGLERRLQHRPLRLSGGEAQRVSLAMALANEPDLLLADEVTGELDSSTAARVLEVIFGATRDRGLTVLFVTHSLELAARAEHRLILVDRQVKAL